MPHLTRHHRHVSLHSLVHATTMMSPSHGRIGAIQAAGGEATAQLLHKSERLYLSDEIQKHLRRVYEYLCEGAEKLSREQLEEFFEKTQRQEVNLSDKQEYTFQEFLEVVWYNNGFTALKEKNPAETDLSKPISHYFISSSHNTYLSGNQLSSKSSTEAYKNVLIRGCRCIEIDVWNGEAPTSITPQRPHFSSSLSSQAASVAKMAVKEAKEKYEHGKQLGKGILAEKMSHHRFPSFHSDTPSIEEMEEESAVDSSGAGEALGPVSTRSARGSRHNSNSNVRPEPRVLHGWTLTSEVSFRDVCRTIRETAFVTTNLPLIVSLEVHADLEQQEIMVEIMKEEWKGLLIDEAYEYCNPSDRLPRLNELFNKILVKVKKATPIQPPGKIEPTPSSSSLAPSLSTNKSLSPSRTEDGDSGYSGSEDDRAIRSKRKAKSKICDSLSRLGVYTHSAHFSSFDQDEARHPPHVFSISENQILELHATKQAEMFAHNRKFFMRAYPSGRRIDSSNPDPSMFWRRGVQMVALNWQSWDEGTMVNEAMFANEHGWVLKPPAFRSQDSTSEPVPAITRVTLNFKITILAGQHIPFPFHHDDEDTFCPYVKCELHVDRAEGPPMEGCGMTKEGRWKLSTRHARSDHPDWGPAGAVMNFVGVENVIEDLSFVRLKVEDERYVKDTLAAWACIRLDRLQQGYRFIKLLDAKGMPTDGVLLVKVERTVLGTVEKSTLVRSVKLGKGLE